MLSPDLLSHLETELALEEGDEHFVYDDAKGPIPFKKGDTLQGNLTAAVGVNLSAGLDDEEVRWLSQHRMGKIVAYLENLPWYATLDSVRATAIADIVFNLGINAQERWPHFFNYVAQWQWENAVSEIRSNQIWVSQVHQSRAGRLEGMLLTGNWPTDVDYTEADNGRPVQS